MLIPLQEKDFDKYVDFAYELALDPARTFYPVFFDGIKTKEDFIARARKAFSKPEDEILLYQTDGAVEGWLHYYHLPEDHYIQLYSFSNSTIPFPVRRQWKEYCCFNDCWIPPRFPHPR